MNYFVKIHQFYLSLGCHPFLSPFMLFFLAICHPFHACMFCEPVIPPNWSTTRPIGWLLISTKKPFIGLLGDFDHALRSENRRIVTMTPAPLPGFIFFSRGEQLYPSLRVRCPAQGTQEMASTQVSVFRPFHQGRDRDSDCLVASNTKPVHLAPTFVVSAVVTRSYRNRPP